MEQVVDLELRLGEGDFPTTKLIFQLDELILEFDSSLSLVVKISLESILRLSELLSLIFQHELKLSESTMFFWAI